MRGFFIYIGCIICFELAAKPIHVSKNGNAKNSGSIVSPFLTIQQAANIALPGDSVIIHSGIYREQVNPIYGGSNNENRIVYTNAPKEKVEIKGSEEIKNWTKVSPNAWRVAIANDLFKDYNPYKDSVHGDWFNGKGRIHHTGEVFLNGKSLFERTSLEQIYNPKTDSTIQDKQGSLLTWFCIQENNHTVIYANFGKANPNKEVVEISFRKTCFYPTAPNRNYITINGIEFSQAATQWAAPTAEQVGIVSTHWNKGWIIENCIIHDSKSVGITLGKEKGTGHNVWSEDAANINRDGNIHYIEVVFKTIRNSWNKETIGSHIVRNNIIYNCEQAGICGSMGAAFSTIENNHIYNIWTKRQFKGFEIAAIKFHGGIDVVIKHNRLNNNGRAIWLDWMSQGARVTQNVCYKNDEDLFIEVNHGPMIVDNNIFLSPLAMRNWSQSTAIVHNLVGGAINQYADPDRFTPYFLSHSTDVAGLNVIYGGDDKYYNNIFVGFKDTTINRYVTQTNPTKLFNTKVPDQSGGNFWYNQPIAFTSTIENNCMNNNTAQVSILEEGNDVYLLLNLGKDLTALNVKTVTTETFNKAKTPKVNFEDESGAFVFFNTDLLGKKRTQNNNIPGPVLIDANNSKVKLF